jgi:predicted enzyme related to lactoylglutathione lyase
MVVRDIELVWIVVKDLKAALRFYVDVVGLKLIEFHEQYNWAELEGYNGGTRLGVAQEHPEEKIGPGQNAIITFTVLDLDQSKKEMVQRGAKCDGDVIEIPGQVRMQMILDNDGNRFQICERLSSRTGAV